MRATSPLGYHLFRCVKAARAGAVDVLEVADLPIQDLRLQPNELLVRASYAGVNFIDTYFRTGVYQKPQGFPFIVGEEGSGAVVQCGSQEDKDRWLNKRVAYFKNISGSYSAFVKVDRSQVFEVPEGVTDDVAAAVMLQGCTAHYLTHDTYPVRSGDVVLVHAAAGGTGLLTAQMAKARGAGLVIGICGGAEKAALATTVGKCDVVIDYKAAATQDWAAEVRRIAPEGCHVVYDGVGKSTFGRSLACLRRRGMMVSFGNASGVVDPVSPLALLKGGSLYLTRPTLVDFVSTRAEAEARVAAVFEYLRKGDISVTIGGRFKLDDAAAAQTALEAQQTTGKLLINCQE